MKHREKLAIPSIDDVIAAIPRSIEALMILPRGRIALAPKAHELVNYILQFGQAVIIFRIEDVTRIHLRGAVF